MPLLRLLSLLALASLGSAAVAAQDKSAGRALTQVETERRVKDDLARRLRVRAEDVRIVESNARVWTDSGLGCGPRRGVFEERRQGVPGDREPTTVPGFEIVAEADGRRSVYHTDRRGRLLRCSTPRKPIDRIQ
jgi:hypothetical protein